jgi:uncharacterized protein YkwD
MKAIKLLPFMAIVALLCFTSCTKDDTLDHQTNAIDILTAPQSKQIEIEIMERINTHRITLGLSALADHNMVKAVASTHTDYMIEVDNVSHDNFFQRKQSLQTNASANLVSENVAYGFSSAEAVVNAWLNSPSHRANIEGDFTNFDVSAEKNNHDKWYFTNIFIKR